MAGTCFYDGLYVFGGCQGTIYFPDAELCTELAEHEYQYDKMQELWFIDTLNMVVHYRNDLVTRVIISDIMAST